MSDIMQIQWNKPYGKISHIDPTKQKVFYTQNGIDYDAQGKACNAKQVTKHLNDVAAAAQEEADAALAAAKAAQESAAAAAKTASAVRKAR